MAGDEDQPLKAPEVGAAMAGVEDQPLKAPEAGAARVDDREEEEEDLEDHPARLPADVLADILRRVEPRWLAASRCVCKAWRDAVDGRRLLRADLLPLSLAGLFVHFDNHKFPEFLACPSSSAAGGRAVSGNLSFLPSASPHCGYFWQEGCVDFDDYNIEDHCNGLLLLRSYCVVNPATRQWNTLPTPPAKRGAESVRYRALLVYDPMTSTYFEVFRIPILDDIDPSMEESEWPPRLCKMHVFSSKSGCWEQKDFIREGGAAGTMGELGARYNQVTAAYFRGELYVHCETYFIMRYPLTLFITVFLLDFYLTD
jgi:hypothetical protein